MIPGTTLIPGTTAIPGPGGTLGVLTLAAAKIYLNIPSARTTDDVELAGFIPAAAARVNRHLGRDPLPDAPLEVLAVKVVLDEYWRTQRSRGARRSSGATAGAIDTDSGPAGGASLKARLTDLLGDPAAGGGGVPSPSGSFPCPEPWPDPALAWSGRRGWSSW